MSKYAKLSIMKMVPTLLFLFGILFLGCSIAVIIITEHGYISYLKNSRYVIESMRFYKDKRYYVPAFFPKYMVLEKDEADMTEAIKILNPPPKKGWLEFDIAGGPYERYIPIDTLTLSVLFFVLAYLKTKRSSRLV